MNKFLVSAAKYLLLYLFLILINRNSIAQSFSAPTTVSVGTSPRDLVVADVNLDGRPDLLTADNGSNSVSVRLGNGAGGFSGTTSVAVDGPPNNLFIADVNNDGRPDLVTSNGGTINNSLSIRLGDGTGSFTGTSVVLLPLNLVGAFGVFVADIDLDGRQDYLVGNSNSVYFARGNGTGGVTDTTRIDIASQPRQVAVGDINKDGKPDFVAAAAGTNVVSARVGDGLGGFSFVDFENWNIGGATLPWSVILRDVNRDGNLDFITANRTSNDVTVRFGLGDGKFSTVSVSRYSVGGGATRVDASDLDLDGNIDIVSANRTGNSISILRGVGSGSFGTATNISVGNSPESIVASDVNQDGKPDLLVANSADNTVSVLLNTTTITLNPFGAAYGVSVGSTPNRIFVADVNLDGKPDILTAGRFANTVSVRLGDGIGGFTGTTEISVGDQPFGLFVADVNLDGKPDILTANQNAATVSVRLGDGSGNFSGTTEISVGSNPASVFVSDVNQDGKPDFVTANFSGTLSVRLGDGAGGFSGGSNFSPGGSPRNVFIADLNNDSRPDVISASGGANAAIVRIGNGTGSFPTGSTISAGIFTISVFSKDINNDGNPDIIASNNNSANVSVALATGGGAFSTATNYAVGTQPSSVFIADLNLDGKQDFVTGNNGSNSVSFRLGDGLGGFSSLSSISVGTNPLSVFVADVNLDGKPDILTADFNSNRVSVILNDQIPNYSGAPSGISAITYNNVTFTAGTLPLSTSFGVNATLTLNGNVELNGNTITVNNTATGAVAGTGRLFGTGSLVRAFNGDVSYSFPFLEGSDNRSATVAFTSGTGSGTLSFSFFPDPPGITGLPLTLISQPVNTVAPFYWRITSTGSPGTYTLTLNGANMLGVTNLSTLRIAKRAVSGSWSDAGIGTGVSNTGTTSAPVLSQSGMTGFGEFAISGDGVDNPLPVELQSFTARSTGDGAKLEWRTASEFENAGFLIYRDGNPIASFSTTASLKGKGTTSVAQSYSYVDSTAVYGKTYRYQLKDVSFSGRVTEHPPITLEMTVKRTPRAYALLQNYPNPFNPSTRIGYQIPAASLVSLTVYDVLGRVVQELVNANQDAGVYEVSFNASGIASGVYYYRMEVRSTGLQTVNFKQTKKMVLVK
ncbi:MAG: FG-GAP-like repeat-containing protein [Chloroherpetonaceae bacterium]|nr:FG-GAP-like repeat-containing protein [Chloroherpetonaceae bacterium]